MSESLSRMAKVGKLMARAPGATIALAFSSTHGEALTTALRVEEIRQQCRAIGMDEGQAEDFLRRVNENARRSLNSYRSVLDAAWEQEFRLWTTGQLP